MRLAICSVGLVSPRSTWLSIGAETPERSARSRSERSIASRSALTRGPTAATVGSAAAAITFVRYHVRLASASGLPYAQGVIRELPDALVLGAGGTLGEAWLRGVLNGLEAGAGLDFRDCEYFLGTSAGSIVARRWRPGGAPRPAIAPRRVGASACPTGSSPPEDSDWLGAVARGGRAAAATPLAPLAMAATARAGRLARAAVLRRSPRPERTLGDLGAHIEALGARFDGRLRIAAVDRAQRPARDLRRARRAARDRRRRPCSPPAPCRGSSRRSRSASASTSTAASGARRTSTRCPPAAARGSCA